MTALNLTLKQDASEAFEASELRELPRVRNSFIAGYIAGRAALAQSPVSARKITNAEVEGWIERNNLGNALHLYDARNAINDAVSIHLTDINSTAIAAADKGTTS